MTAMSYEFKRASAKTQSSAFGKLLDVLSGILSAIEAALSASVAGLRRRQSGDKSALRLISRCAVSGRSSVAVVDWEGQRFLVGVGAESVSVITPLAAQPVGLPSRLREEELGKPAESGLKISLNDWVEEREQTSGLGIRGGRKRVVPVLRGTNRVGGSGVAASPHSRHHSRHGRRRDKRVHSPHSSVSARRDGQW